MNYPLNINSKSLRKIEQFAHNEGITTSQFLAEWLEALIKDKEQDDILRADLIASVTERPEIQKEIQQKLDRGGVLRATDLE